MKNEIQLLKQKFDEIKNMGYIKSISNYSSGGGMTLEKLLNIRPNNLCYPDYNGIELKTINQYWEKNINLFCDTPTSTHITTIKWITDMFGYPDKSYRNYNIFNGRIDTKNYTKVGSNYFFRINVERKEKKIILEIYDSKMHLINNEIYWDFIFLKSKLETKLKLLAVIYLEKKYLNKIQYCKYNKIKFYKLKNFDTFIKLIEEGIIKINICTGYNKSKKNKGKFHDHGTKFYINEKNLYRLFNRIEN